MKTLDRYIAGIFVKNVITSIIGMAALFWFQSMFTDLYDHTHPMHQILTYHMLNLPQVIVQMSPPGILLATVLTLSGLSRTAELIACHAIGVGLRRIMGVILMIVVVVSALILVANDRILPHVFRVRTDYRYIQMEKRLDFFLDVRRDKIWYRSKNMIYNLQRFDPQLKTIHGMSIYTFDEHFNLIQVIGAEKAEHTEKGWKLRTGAVAVFPSDDAFPLIQDFDKKEVLLEETPKDFLEIEKEVDGLRLKDLYSYIQRMNNAGANTKAYEVKFHSRISQSLIPVVMCLLAVPFSIGRRREGGMAADLGFCLLMTFVYWLTYSVGLAMGSNGALPPVAAAWLSTGLFFGLAIVMIIRKHETT